MERRATIGSLVVLALAVLASCPIAAGQGLSRGHKVLLERGLQLQAMTFVPQTGYFDPVRWAESNFTTIDFCGSPYPASLMPAGTKNMPWSRYMYHAADTQTFTYAGVLNHVVSESEVRLSNFAAWAFGCKLVCSFFYENRKNSPSLPVMFSGDGTKNPTPVFYQVAETNRQSLNLGPALIRLKSRHVAMKTGRYFHANKPNCSEMPVGVAAWDSSCDPYITDIKATNIGALNHGLEGDIIVGYFQPLDPSFADPGHAEDLYFMAVNGLSNPKGSAAECRQSIRLDFDFGDSNVSSLLRLSRETGEVEKVALVHKGGSLYGLDIEFDGGTGELFKFDNGGAFVSKPAH